MHVSIIRVLMLVVALVAIVVALFAGALWVGRRFIKRNPDVDGARTIITRTGFLLYGCQTLLLFAGLAAPGLRLRGPLGTFFQHSWALLAYIAFLLAGVAVASKLLTRLGLPPLRDKDEAPASNRTSVSVPSPDTGNSGSAVTVERPKYRCARCGVESAEPKCFVIPRKYDRPPRDVRCLMCEQARRTPDTLKSLRIVGSALLFPIFVYVPIAHGVTGLTIWIVAVAALMQPLATGLHELGHALVAKLVGLDVAAIELGFGKRIWKRQIGETLLVLRLWPLSGRTYFGTRGRSLVRLRAWLTILAGPATNVVLILPAAFWWRPLTDLAGVPLTMLWVLMNVAIVIANLIPRRVVSAGRLQRTDGLALIEIPRLKDAQLAPYFVGAFAARVLAATEDHDYFAAIAACQRGLRQVPHDPTLELMLSGSQNMVGEYAEGLATATSASDTKEPVIQAAFRNNRAFSLLMLNVDHVPDDPALVEADHLSKAAYDAFPCLLFVRSTRALILAATARPDEALKLLEYQHYRTAPVHERGDGALTRAFALRMMGRMSDAEAAAREAMALSPKRSPILETLGFREAVDRGRMVVFDGVCNLCSGGARWLEHHQADPPFRLVAMQSDLGRTLLVQHGYDPDDPLTFLVIDGPQSLTESDAWIHLVAAAGGGWRLALAMRVIPRVLRDSVYRLIARNRYRWFGRRTTCYLAQPSVESDRSETTGP
jgi:predicted DCC family thiol-disulfide oxidoreductase YuxK